MQTRAAVEKFVTLNIVCIGDLYTGRIYQTAQRDILDNLSFQYEVAFSLVKVKLHPPSFGQAILQTSIQLSK